MTQRFEHFSAIIFNICRCWNKIAGDEMKKVGLKGSCAMYLCLIGSHDGTMTASRLSDFCGKDKADVSRALALLEEKDLIRRTGGGYRAALALTEQGLKLKGYLDQRIALVLDIAGGDLTDTERETMYAALDAVAARLKILSQEGLPDPASF